MRLLRSLCSFLLLLVEATAHDDAAASSSSRLSAPSSSLCPSRTANYLTHGLPPQCLTSSRSVVLNTTAGNSSSHESILPVAPLSLPEELEEDNKTDLQPYTTGLATRSSESSPFSASTTTSITTPTTSVTQTSASTVPLTTLSVPVDDLDSDSPLGTASFLSFEEWKKQNLVKAGQSEHLGGDRQVDQQEPRKRPGNVQYALDSLGDDAEIDLDFSAFVPGPPDMASPRLPQRSSQDEGDEQVPGNDAASAKPRSPGKDAGTTSKERFNYASFDCAANVLKTNKQAKGSSSVLGENKDSYMLNECSADNKFLILELCSDIQIDTIVLANFEFFSSTFRVVRVSVSDRYPVKIDKWKTLGTFQARNSRDVQAFLVESPVMWARYVRFEFLTHYGNEFYCPVSLVRIHGKTMLEEYKHDLDSVQGEDEEDDRAAVDYPDKDEFAGPEAVAEILTGEHVENAKSENEAVSEALEVGAFGGTHVQAPTATTEAQQTSRAETTSVTTSHTKRQPSTIDCNPALLFGTVPTETCAPDEEPSGLSADNGAELLDSTQDCVSESANSNSFATSMPEKLSTNIRNASSTIISNTESAAVQDGADSLEQAQLKSTFSFQAEMTTAPTTTTKNPQSSTQSASAVPTMQESFFKSVQKRLQMLETNSSLSLLYIEEQSRALRDAFSKVEQRQLAKTSTFLDYLNTTVLNELRDFRQQYDHLWQSTVIELEMQREQFSHETVAINARLGVLADELIFQQRMSMLLMVLILVCLGLVLFSRGSMHNYLDLPIVQNVLSRSPSSRWMTMSGLDTPSQSPPASRPTSSHTLKPAHGILKGQVSRSSHEMIGAITDANDMQTLTSYDEPSDTEHSKGRPLTDDPVFDPSTIERPSTSPPGFSGKDTPMTPESLPALDDFTIDSVLSDDQPSTINGHRLPEITLDGAPSQAKHLTWQLPDS